MAGGNHYPGDFCPETKTFPQKVEEGIKGLCLTIAAICVAGALALGAMVFWLIFVTPIIG